jgi:uncharacterized protein (DUF1697 family)
VSKYIAFIRGINVGGIVLKMDDLKKILDHAGFKKIQTYIQSGNAIFESSITNIPEIEKKIKSGIFKESGLDIVVIVKTKEELEKITASHPFEEKDNQKGLYITILNTQPIENKVRELMDLKSDVDKFILKGDIVYSYYGDGYGKSKFTNNYIENKLSASGTTRNWNTMKKIAELSNV